MEVLLSVRIDPDTQGVKRRVRSDSGGFKRGSMVEVETAMTDGTRAWVLCRVDRWMTGHLWVTEIPVHANSNA